MKTSVSAYRGRRSTTMTAETPADAVALLDIHARGVGERSLTTGIRRYRWAMAATFALGFVAGACANVRLL